MAEKVKNIVITVLCGAMVIGAMGATVFAATKGTLTGTLTNDIAIATLKNQSGSDRYCSLIIREYNSAPAYTTIKSSGGTISSGNTMTVSGQVTKSHAQGVGVIYNSNTSASGAAKTYTTQIK